MSNQQDYLGKPCFFLFPNNEVKKNIVSNVFMNGFETYNIDTNKKLDTLFTGLHDLVLFICLNSGADFDLELLKETLTIVGKKKSIKTNFIIEENMRDKLDKLKNINSDNIYEIDKDYNKIYKSIIDYLERVEARGRRKYVRANCSNCTKSGSVSFKISIDDEERFGKINDISIAGMLASLDDKELWLDIGKKIEKIELWLNGSHAVVSGKIFRDETGFDENLYVILFDVDDISEYDKNIISTFVYNCLQMYIKRKIEAL